MNRLAIVFLYVLVSCSPAFTENNLNPTTSDKLLSSVTATFSDYVFETEYEYDLNYIINKNATPF
ncbi:hypothetical protein [uncultured Psychroserpens sp.]|uniref:hypothetical protein n=1 Tax=uncultured Psychroserpens sp. TaxID=255436 RepID=UPI0026156D3F|nr:hypothetical protein [uncultured Psychroserpens sp.]